MKTTSAHWEDTLFSETHTPRNPNQGHPRLTCTCWVTRVKPRGHPQTVNTHTTQERTPSIGDHMSTVSVSVHTQANTDRDSTSFTFGHYRYNIYIYIYIYVGFCCHFVYTFLQSRYTYVTIYILYIYMDTLSIYFCICLYIYIPTCIYKYLYNSIYKYPTI